MRSAALETAPRHTARQGPVTVSKARGYTAKARAPGRDESGRSTDSFSGPPRLSPKQPPVGRGAVGRLVPVEHGDQHWRGPGPSAPPRRGGAGARAARGLCRCRSMRRRSWAWPRPAGACPTRSRNVSVSRAARSTAGSLRQPTGSDACCAQSRICAAAQACSTGSFRRHGPGRSGHRRPASSSRAGQCPGSSPRRGRSPRRGPRPSSAAGPRCGGVDVGAGREVVRIRGPAPGRLARVDLNDLAAVAGLQPRQPRTQDFLHLCH